jgi:hypothetical protein
VILDAESLTDALSRYDPGGSDRATSPDRLLDDCYAQLLRLEAQRLKLEAELARLSEADDPEAVTAMRGFSVTLRTLSATTEQLRDALAVERTRLEPRG